MDRRGDPDRPRWEEGMVRPSITWSLEAFAARFGTLDPDRAARLWGAAQALRQALGWPLPPHEREECDRQRDALRDALGEEAFAALSAEGRTMTLEQAMEC